MIVKFESVKGLSIFIGIFLVIFILLAILVPKETTEETQARLTELRRNAYNDAINCSNTTQSNLQFDQITWVVVPGNTLRYKVVDGVALLKGFYSRTDSTIYIPETEKETYWILVHESLHAIGYIGHPDHPFRTCKALPEQN